MKNNKIIISIGILLIGLVIGILIIVNLNKNKVQVKKTVKTQESESIVPTTDASTKANLTSLNSGKEVTLKIEGIPSSTTTIEYQLSYETKQQGFQGMIGTFSPSNNEKVFEKTMTLGTCSSGKCVYHEVVGEIKVTLKFNGDYGEKILEKGFSL